MDIPFKEAKIEYIDRAVYGADIAITIPALLKEHGSEKYTKDIVPEIARKVSEEGEFGAIKKTEQKGIYLNILLDDAYIFSTLSALQDSGESFGKNAKHEGETVVIDYSSPNVAKHLHAGHIRSTIIGQVLYNIYSSCGYNVHGVNHINDWGGFGFLIAEYEDMKDRRGSFRTGNDFLYFLYTEYRNLEKEGGDKWDSFKERADLHFRNLEAGAKEEKEIWEKMVAWSMEEFNGFYDKLGIKFDSVMGESAYAKSGAELVKEWLAEGKAVEKDGAATVLFGEGENDFLVVRRGDESTIYSTRDLAAIKYRVEKFNPSRIVYVVGQEQGDHFRRLFAAAKKLGLDGSGSVRFEHVYFGYYINAETKKKLSSREGAESVDDLIEKSVSYFLEKYKDKTDVSNSEKAENARKIAIGSIIFNDIKKGRKLPVELHAETKKTIEEFEESGGAYVMYTLARAKNIVRKYGGEVPNARTVAMSALDNVEINLIKKVNGFSAAVLRAEEFSEPSVVAEYLLRLAQDYNSYYENFPVLDGEKLAYPHRLVITDAVEQVIANGLKMCHISAPERI